MLELVSYEMCVFSFSWTKDGSALVITGTEDVTMKVCADNGTLIIMSPGPSDEGVYQCFASTTFGIAASVFIQLQQACKSHCQHRVHLLTSVQNVTGT